jgi:truncated hemoglobin YjbI
MHWYVNFRDPVLVEGSEPTPYQWAGGLTALTRMSRLFYEKHGPDDPLLAPLLAGIGPGQAQRLAAWLDGALGGPARNSASADVRQVTIGAASAEFTEPRRARWVTLLCTAADEAALPADPQFRSVLSSCLEWASRTALALTRAGADPQQVPAPRWDWGPGGPPAAPAAAEEETDSEVTLPGPDEPVSFATHIKPLFRERDRQSMSFAFDLWSFADVSSRAAEILGRLRDGSMPCDGAWPEAKIEVFQRWASTGLRP